MTNEKIILLNHNVECSTLNGESFAEFMLADMIEAKRAFVNHYEPIERAEHEMFIARVRKNKLEAAQKYAAEKWKTEKKRQAYVEKTMSEYKPSEFKLSALEYFRFRVTPYCDYDCPILSYKHLTKEDMLRIFDKIKDNKYFKLAKGWVFEEQHTVSPTIKLILDDEHQSEFDEISNNIAKSIADYYTTSRYTGD